MLIIVLVHVDNCTIVGKSLLLINWFKVEIAKYVDIIDMGDLHCILGIKVCRISEEGNPAFPTILHRLDLAAIRF